MLYIYILQGPSRLLPPQPEAGPSTQFMMKSLKGHIAIEVDNETPDWLTEEQGYNPSASPAPVSKTQQRKGLGPPVKFGAFNNIEGLKRNYWHTPQIMCSLPMGDLLWPQMGQLPQSLGQTSQRRAQWFNLCSTTELFFIATVEVVDIITPALCLWGMHALMHQVHGVARSKGPLCFKTQNRTPAVMAVISTNSILVTASPLLAFLDHWLLLQCRRGFRDSRGS